MCGGVESNEGGGATLRNRGDRREIEDEWGV